METSISTTPSSQQGPKDATEVSDVRLSDFGAAATVDDPALRRLEVRSFGWLLQDLLESHVQPSDDSEVSVVALLKDIRERCGHELPASLPGFAEIAAELRCAASHDARS